METIELIPAAIRPEDDGPLKVSGFSAAKVARAIAKTYPVAPYAEVESIAAELIAHAQKHPGVVVFGHGCKVVWLRTPETAHRRVRRAPEVWA